MRAYMRIAYINYTKKLRIFNILNLFCVVYVLNEYIIDVTKCSSYRKFSLSLVDQRRSNYC